MHETKLDFGVILQFFFDCCYFWIKGFDLLLKLGLNLSDSDAKLVTQSRQTSFYLCIVLQLTDDYTGVFKYIIALLRFMGI